MMKNVALFAPSLLGLIFVGAQRLEPSAPLAPLEAPAVTVASEALQGKIPALPETECTGCTLNGLISVPIVPIWSGVYVELLDTSLIWIDGTCTANEEGVCVGTQCQFYELIKVTNLSLVPMVLVMPSSELVIQPAEIRTVAMKGILKCDPDDLSANQTRFRVVYDDNGVTYPIYSRDWVCSSCER